MIEVKRKEKETGASVIRRFSRKVQQSFVLSKARASRFKKRAKSDLKQKQEALKREKKAKRVLYLKKLGKIK
jgi:ribosomal protein S21